MTTQKIDPKDPLFRKMIQNRFKAVLFLVPAVIGLAIVTTPLRLPLLTEAELIFSSTLLGNGLAHYYYACDLGKQFKKQQQKQSPQA